MRMATRVAIAIVGRRPDQADLPSTSSGGSWRACSLGSADPRLAKDFEATIASVANVLKAAGPPVHGLRISLPDH